MMDFLSQNANAGMIGLLFFFVIFVVFVSWLFRPGAKEEYKQHGEIPLRKEQAEVRQDD
ncbi:MAG: cbb3-type cytochrome c oxidase subunit 3 [Alphaproteobacteria bacterium]|nr:cbb3-type cytochrome c oxidase subunit 3 [Alphaproteobacteria bacterium]